ncbi:arginyl-tRNA-protein transferase (plasmid) [Azospirillum argentinense]|uniref:Aspartate/glutamate leucyltransferase n=2 Tax=Azospirillum TaxID=191 RepID=A0A060DU48_9PROT|nr:arginyltransferase [Azospirillum argentinense]AIB14703.1 arginyl-tRNA-protein transferase [Azospirillum argentinense]EZQ05127.1 arginyl-tRNA-protein transferase [Azospirillum argentinense]KAA1056000.1 Arginyl-tRNA--protein transferase [Azospirillum argentinense]PNQ99323.1 arginyltransferase [Azospirillum argentinense]QCO04744.1 arginyltransferase [Azospirillum argentinense]
MSVIQPQLRPLQQFFRSGPMPCPYLPGRVERKLFTRLLGPYSAEVNSTLSRAGFRRSHDIVYRPVCPNCQACVPVRIPVGAFTPTRSQKRVLRGNGDLTLAEAAAAATTEQYRLFSLYQNSRHGESDMARMAMADFAAMIDEGRADTSLLEARDAEGRLVGCMLTDRLTDGYSAVYSFYDPRQDRRSLGSFMILSLLERAQADGLPYVYLGYWIAQSRKMAYKAKFRPLEALGRDGWFRLPNDPTD